MIGRLNNPQYYTLFLNNVHILLLIYDFCFNQIEEFLGKSQSKPSRAFPLRHPKLWVQPMPLALPSFWPLAVVVYAGHASSYHHPIITYHRPSQGKSVQVSPEQDRIGIGIGLLLGFDRLRRHLNAWHEINRVFIVPAAMAALSTIASMLHMENWTQ